VRGFSSILGVMIVLVNLACAALCGVPAAPRDEKPLPPCHQQEHKIAKACAVQDWQDLAERPVWAVPVVVAILPPVPSAPVARMMSPVERPLALGPPLPLRL